MTLLIHEIQNDTRYSERTQISLSPTLRRIIEKERASTGESLSEYIRNAIMIRVKKEESTDEARMRAIKAFVGAGKGKSHPHWSSKKKIMKWQREMREDPPRLSQ